MRAGGGLRRSRNPSQRRTDASQQLGRAEGLVDEVVGARVQGFHFVLLGVAHGEHDDPHAGAGADLAAGSQSAHARHIHVEQDQVGMIIAQLLERLFAGLGVVHFIAGASESGPHDAADLGLVVYHQDASGAHGRAPWASGVLVAADSSSGKVTRKVVSPGRLFTVSSP